MKRIAATRPIAILAILATGVLPGSVVMADPAHQTLEQAAAALERENLRADSSDRPSILYGPLAPSTAANLSMVSTDCGDVTPRTVNGRLRVRCTIATTRIDQKEARPIEEEIAELPNNGARGFSEACAYLSGRPMLPESDRMSYRSASSVWSALLATRLDSARAQQTDGQKSFLPGIVQACATKDKDRFVQTYVTYLRQVEERTCRLSVWSESADFDKADTNTWIAAPGPNACGETVALTLWRNPRRYAYSEPWNYKSVTTYPATAAGPLCASLAGKTAIEEFLVTNRRLRDPGCVYFEM